MSQIGIVVEMITRVIPDDAVPKVQEALEQAMVVIEHRDKAMNAPEEAA